MSRSLPCIEGPHTSRCSKMRNTWKWWHYCSLFGSIIFNPHRLLKNHVKIGKFSVPTLLPVVFWPVVEWFHYVDFEGWCLFLKVYPKGNKHILSRSLRSGLEKKHPYRHHTLTGKYLSQVQTFFTTFFCATLALAHKTVPVVHQMTSTASEFDKCFCCARLESSVFCLWLIHTEDTKWQLATLLPFSYRIKGRGGACHFADICVTTYTRNWCAYYIIHAYIDS